MSTRRQFLVQSVKAGLAIAAGVLSGAALMGRPKPTYEVPNRSGDDLWIGNPDLVNNLSFPLGPPDGKLHHCAAQWDGENITQWVDGERVPNT